MSTSTAKLWQLYEGLKDKFLFQNDINSIYILLTLYDMEESISNIYPKYVCTKNIKRRIKYNLKRNNKESIANNICYILHDDINRIELCFYLEGYKYGYYNSRIINDLETKSLQMYSIEKMYNSKYLFHFNHSNKIIKKIRLKLSKEIDKHERNKRFIQKAVNIFCEKVIRKKIYNFEEYINKQLSIKYNPYNFDIIEEEYKLTKNELDKIYKTTLKSLNNNLKKIYKDAAWYALNDKVLKRYK